MKTNNIAYFFLFCVLIGFSFVAKSQVYTDTNSQLSSSNFSPIFICKDSILKNFEVKKVWKMIANPQTLGTASSTYQMNSDQTLSGFSTHVFCPTDIVVSNNATLAIGNGATLYMAPGKKITFENGSGSRLVKNRGRITSASCDSAWYGIDVFDSCSVVIDGTPSFNSEISHSINGLRSGANRFQVQHCTFYDNYYQHLSQNSKDVRMPDFIKYCTFNSEASTGQMMRQPR